MLLLNCPKLPDDYRFQYPVFQNPIYNIVNTLLTKFKNIKYEFKVRIKTPMFTSYHGQAINAFMSSLWICGTNSIQNIQ